MHNGHYSLMTSSIARHAAVPFETSLRSRSFASVREQEEQTATERDLSSVVCCRGNERRKLRVHYLIMIQSSMTIDRPSPPDFPGARMINVPFFHGSMNDV